MASPHNDRRKRYNASRVRWCLDLSAQIEAVPAQVLRDELATTDRLLIELGERFAAGKATARDEEAVARWIAHALPAYRQFSIALVHLNALLSVARQPGGTATSDGSRP